VGFVVFMALNMNVAVMRGMVTCSQRVTMVSLEPFASIYLGFLPLR